MKKKKPFKMTYTLMGELMASATQPLDAFWRTEQVKRMRAGLACIESGDNPTPNDWRICSDAVNLMETMVMTNNGWWPGPDGGLIRVADASGLLLDAVEALAHCGDQHMEGKALRLSGYGIQAIRAVLDDYEDVLAAFPARTMFKCHRITEKRVAEILSGKSLSHDVSVLAV